MHRNKHTNASPADSDQELAAGLKGGSQKAYQAIYNRYWGLLYIHAFKMLKDEDDAKDVIQELFTYLWAHRQEIEFRVSLKAYLYTALRNRILNLFDSQEVRNKHALSLAAYFDEQHLIVEEQLREKELRNIIEQEIALLPEKMRQVFELSRKYELSHKEIAGELNISDKTVKKQISNAIKILRLKISYLFLLLIIFVR